MTRILLNWAVVLAAFAMIGQHPSAPLLVLSFLLIGIEQHALGLWMHEGVHGLIAKNKLLNDAIVIGLLSGPLLVPLGAFRQRHFTHHRYLGTPLDTKPVIFTRVDGRQFWMFLLRNCFGLQFFRIAGGYFSSAGDARKITSPTALRWLVDLTGIVLAQAGLFLVICQLASWPYYLMLWLLPWLTINRFIAGLRSVIEHQPLAAERHPFTRMLQPTWLDRFLFCRVGFQYHREHHRFPRIPYFNLPLVDDESPEVAAARLGYWQTFLLLHSQSTGVAARIGPQGQA